MTAATQPRLSRDSRYDALLDAAAQLLADDGFSAVTMEAVAAQAGVSRPLVYKHFDNREALLAALWRREAAAIDAAGRARPWAEPAASRRSCDARSRRPSMPWTGAG